MAQYDKKILPAALHIWVSIYHKMVLFVTQVENDEISRFFFIFLKLWFSGLLRGGGRGVIGQKMTQNDKKFCLALYLRNCASYDCGFWYTFVKWWYLQQFFSFFQKFDFLGFSKFLNQWQKEILRCVPPSLHVWHPFCLEFAFTKGTGLEDQCYLCKSY